MVTLPTGFLAKSAAAIESISASCAARLAAVAWIRRLNIKGLGVPWSQVPVIVFPSGLVSPL
jgi:hypothetical protein